jgi:hypothetical protein
MGFGDSSDHRAKPPLFSESRIFSLTSMTGFPQPFQILPMSPRKEEGRRFRRPSICDNGVTWVIPALFFCLQRGFCSLANVFRRILGRCRLQGFLCGSRSGPDLSQGAGCLGSNINSV